jgi:predicted P-loop ATPase
MERMRFKSVPKELARDAAVLVADECQFDSAQVWLRSLPAWDGVPRVETFLTDRWGVSEVPGEADGPGDGGRYARAVSRYMWTALAGRVLDPGCQADMAVILQGEQGLQKTSGVAALAPGREFFVELDFTKDDAELARLMRGALVGEISELRGLHTKDHEGIKSFVSRRFEKWTPKYKEFATTFARRCVLFGTTNPAGVLSDDTGNRRWLPVHVESVDVAGIERDRDQLWAEAAARFEGLVGGAGGVDWREAEALAEGVHAEYMVEDEWQAPIAAWLSEVDGFSLGAGARGDSPFTVYELLLGALGMTGREVNMLTAKRVGLVLRGLGYAKINHRDENKVQRKMWVKATRRYPLLPVVLPVDCSDLV